MATSDTERDRAAQRLKIERDFMCERNLDVNTWDCRECPYYYKEIYKPCAGHCLLQNIKYWTLYHMEKGG